MLDTAQGCTAHGFHRPMPHTFESHHVIPRAWQEAWRPDGAPLHEPDHDHPDPRAVTAAPLWDPRTVPLCPSGHRNVHYWLVRMMRALPIEWLVDPTRDDAGTVEALHRVRTAARKEGRTISTHEWEIAGLAMARWLDAGGSLGLLIGRGLRGEA